MREEVRGGMLIVLTCRNCGGLDKWVSTQPGEPQHIEGLCDECMVAYQADGQEGLLDRKYPYGPPELIRLSEEMMDKVLRIASRPPEETEKKA